MTELEKKFIKMGEDSTSKYTVHPALVCKDGFTLSIQMHGEQHYAEVKDGRIRSCEILLRSPKGENEKVLDEYSDDYIHAYVPFQIAEEVIEKHGGFSHFQ